MEVWVSECTGARGTCDDLLIVLALAYFIKNAADDEAWLDMYLLVRRGTVIDFHKV